MTDFGQKIKLENYCNLHGLEYFLKSLRYLNRYKSFEYEAVKWTTWFDFNFGSPAFSKSGSHFVNHAILRFRLRWRSPGQQH